MLTSEQVAQFREQGYVVARGAVAPAEVAALTAEIDRWVEESRGHAGNYGTTFDGKARFDLEDGHSAAHPKLRRVANPADISEAYRRVLWQGPIVEMVADLLGPDVKFHHCKLNIKLPGMGTRVDYHQDHPYDPHTNSDMLAALLMLDETTEENGCLRVVPGSQRERHSLYRGDRFVGKVADDVAAQMARRALPMTGAPGDLCLMHTWTMHGSEPNRSKRPRRLLICDYTAADAVMLLPPAVPSEHSGRIVHGKPTRRARLEAGELELPARYLEESFFSVQGQKAAGAA